MKIAISTFAPFAFLVARFLASAGGQALEFNKPIERELAGGQTHSYDLPLEAGQFLKAEIQCKGFAGVIAVYAPDNQPLAKTGGGYDPQKYVALIASAHGRYRIEVSFPNKMERNAAAGRYRMLVAQPRPATEADKHYAIAQQTFNEAGKLFEQATAESRRQAVEKFQQALPEWRAAGDGRREAETLHAIATIRKMLGESRQALLIEQEALALARAAGDRRLEAEVLSGLGTIHFALSDFQQALNIFQQTLRLYRELGDRQGEVDLLTNLGVVSGATGTAQQALDYYLQALPIAREIGKRNTEARLLSNIGVRYLNLGEPRKAAESLQEALAMSRALGLRDDEATSLHNLAGAWLQLGEYQKALDADNQALAVSRATGYSRVEVAVRILLGDIHQRLGDHPQAFEHLREALALSRQAGYRNEEAMALNNFGALHQARGELAQAIAYLEQATAAHRALGVRSVLPSDLIQLGAARQAQGQTEAAMEHFREALALSRELGIPRFEVSALLHLGPIQRSRGERAAAAEALRRALELGRAIHYVSFEIDALGELAALALIEGNYSEARARIEQAIQLIESGLATVGSQELRAGFRGKSQWFYEMWIESLMRQHEQNPMGDFAARALEASEQSRARSLLELLNEARADIRQGIAPDLRERERELRQNLAAKSDRLARVRTSEIDKEQTIALKKEIAALIAEHDEVLTRIRLTSPRYAALVQPEPLKLGEIQKQALDAKTLLLEYSLGEQRSYLFAVTPSAIHSFTLPGRKEIETQARLFYRLVTERGKPGVFRSAKENQQWLARNDQECVAAAKDLSQMLLAPAARLLGNKRLLIVSDGILHYVPFAALPSPATGRQGDGAMGRGGLRPPVSPSPRLPVSLSPLVVNHEIITLPSASVLAAMRRERPDPPTVRKTIAVLADPVFEESDERMMSGSPADAVAAQTKAQDEWAQLRGATMDSDSDSAGALVRLPFTRREAEQIAALAPEKEKRVALGFEATRALALSPELEQYRYIHFATHGLLNNTHPELSGLAFSLFDERAQKQNGFLRGMDVYNLRLPADLVVLSGCRTALGKEVSGEGLIGLTRGFLYAGAKRVVAGLWQVNDAATAELMQRFYKQLLGEKRMTPAAALRAAQVSMWREPRWRSPFYWAPFTIQGEW